MPGSAKLTGLHSVVHIDDALVEKCREEVLRLYMRVKLGDAINPLERVALEVLRANGLI